MPALYRNACSIKHVNYTRDDKFPEIVANVSKVCHMGKGEAALLLFYATCSDGFTPAAKFIAEKIGVKPNYVHALRNALEAKGIVFVQDKKVVLDWKRIKILASLNPKYTTKDGWVKPISIIGIDRLGQFMAAHVSVMDLYTKPLDELIDKLGQMPEYIYRAWRAQTNRILKSRPFYDVNNIL